jgi:hypothetical protein
MFKDVQTTFENSNSPLTSGTLSHAINARYRYERSSIQTAENNPTGSREFIEKSLRSHSLHSSPIKSVQITITLQEFIDVLTNTSHGGQR